MFKLQSGFKPAGSQPDAIKSLVSGLEKEFKYQTLLGVTGSGKTFTMANVIEQIQKPTLVIVHNKTLAAQLYGEFKEFFPENRVEFFVSYYDYYQPESYLPQKDLYIAKDAQINPRIEQMRLSATASILSRRDTIIVASVSCIYGLGNPESYSGLGFELRIGQQIERKELIGKLVSAQFERNDLVLEPGRFRAQGDTIDIVPGYYHNIFRVSLFGSEVEELRIIDRMNGKTVEKLKYFFVYPAKHFVTPEEETGRAVESIKKELEEQLPGMGDLEAHRLKQRTLYDIEMIEETGYCKGIENYSRHFDGRKPGEPPYTLIDYFPDDFLLFIDESHQTIPQLNGMYEGDRSRKKALVDYGFRLPSAFDNRPLKFDEFKKFIGNVVFVSATPASFERKVSMQIVEQIIRPTGLVDPEVEVRKTKGQMDNLLGEIASSIENGNRVLVTTLTKRLAEELTDYLNERGTRARYLHSEIKTLERTEIIRELRLGKFDVLVGINLLREGLDIPEVGLIGILDADKEGFLRNSTSLIQTIGRAARNKDSKVILYADRETDSIKEAVAETNRRRQMQIEFNRQHHIEPKSIVKPVKEKEIEPEEEKGVRKSEIPNLIIELESQMRSAAEALDFEKAIELRERIKKLGGKIG